MVVQQLDRNKMKDFTKRKQNPKKIIFFTLEVLLTASLVISAACNASAADGVSENYLKVKIFNCHINVPTTYELTVHTSKELSFTRSDSDIGTITLRNLESGENSGAVVKKLFLFDNFKAALITVPDMNSPNYDASYIRADNGTNGLYLIGDAKDNWRKILSPCTN